LKKYLTLSHSRERLDYSEFTKGVKYMIDDETPEHYIIGKDRIRKDDEDITAVGSVVKEGHRN
jgi:hypothetical protein